MTDKPYNKPYTVVLLRPDYNAEPYGKDVYTALVEADGACAAITAAQLEVAAADEADGMTVGHPSDYAMVLVFEGHHEPCLFHFSL